MTVCIRIVGVVVVGTGVTGLVWHTYPYDAPGAKLFPGTGTGPSQSVPPGTCRLLLTVMLVSGSVPVLVTTTRHHTSEP